MNVAFLLVLLTPLPAVENVITKTYGRFESWHECETHAAVLREGKKPLDRVFCVAIPAKK